MGFRKGSGDAADVAGLVPGGFGFLVGDAGIVVLGHVNDAALQEAQLFGQVAEGPVGRHGVDAKVAAAHVVGPVEDVLAHALGGAIACHAVDHGVGTVIVPLAVLDVGVGRVGPPDEGKGGDDAAAVLHHEAGALLYVLLDAGGAGPLGGAPLVGVAYAGHEFSGVFIYFHEAIEVGLLGASDFHDGLLWGSGFGMFMFVVAVCAGCGWWLRV